MNQLSIPKAPAPMGWSPNIEDGLNTETQVGKSVAFLPHV